MDGREGESYGFPKVLSFSRIFGCDWSGSRGFDGLVVERLGGCSLPAALDAVGHMVRTRRSEGMQ